MVKYGENDFRFVTGQEHLYRRMTVREVARLQGFPDSYVIPVADASAYKQFGNSVAVPAIQATGKKILDSLEK